MLALKLCQQLFPEKVKFTLSNRLGDGADGEVFELQDYPNKVIKFCVLYEYNNSDIKNALHKTLESLSYIKCNHPSTYAQVYDYMYLGESSRWLESIGKNQNYILYYYIMEKLYKISEDEKRVFHSLLCHEDSNKVKKFSISKIKDMVKGMAQALDFDESRVMFFCENLRRVPLQHQDVHVRNIMKDDKGNFKLIDFDRCQLT